MVYPPAKSRAVWQWGTSIGVLVALVALVLIRDSTLADWVCVNGRCFQQSG